jgi:hypothetical protein
MNCGETAARARNYCVIFAMLMPAPMKTQEKKVTGLLHSVLPHSAL